jgi:hypothetical protein
MNCTGLGAALRFRQGAIKLRRLLADSQPANVDVEGYLTALGEPRNINNYLIAPGYFDVLRMPLLMGRDFKESDDPNTMPVANRAARPRLQENLPFVRMRVHRADRRALQALLKRSHFEYSGRAFSRLHFAIQLQEHLERFRIGVFVESGAHGLIIPSSLSAWPAAQPATGTRYPWNYEP